MKLVSRQNIILICILVIFGLIGFSVILYTLNNLRERYISRGIESHYKLISSEIDTRTQRSVMEASVFVALPVVTQAYDIALSGDIYDPHSPEAQAARELLRNELAPMLDSYRFFSGESLHLHFHLPNGFSLVRLWRDKNAMINGEWVDISEDLRPYRPTVMNTLSTGEITTGIEAGSGGFTIRGIIPVFAPDGRQIGSAEVLQYFDNIISSAVAAEEGVFISLYANVDLLEFAVELRDPEMFPPKGDFIRILEAADSSVDSIITAEMLSKVEGSVIFENSGNFTVAMYPIRDYRGTQTGVLVLTKETTEVTLLINMAVSALSIMFACMVVAPVFMRMFRLRIREAENKQILAEGANKAKSDFMSTMSHEIRTPINAVLGISEIQLQNEQLDPNVRIALEKIYTSGDMLLGIINDLLDISRIESGKFELTNGNYEVASLISDTAQLNMMRIGSKRIEFDVSVDKNIPALVSGDELRVKQILNNLLSNAFKYTSGGMVTFLVGSEASAESDDEVILKISISDTGQGMTEEQINSLFDEFTRFNLKVNRAIEGTGLGMSITKKLIHMMNGEILVESEPGKGSTFTIRIPQMRVGPDVLGDEIAENLHNFRTSSRAQMRRVQITRDPMPYGSVLIVDDVETNIYVATGLLTPYYLNIDSADSGFVAIEKVKSGKIYDIIFMDHMMPGIDGIETTKRIRDMGYSQPIVALTADAVAGQAEVFLKNGFDEFISKPIDIRQLNLILNKLIRDKQSQEVIEAARQQAETRESLLPEKDEPNPAINPYIAEIFVRDAQKSLSVLEEYLVKDNDNEGDLRMFIIHVHGLKSALSNIGKEELSATASKLEQFARDGDVKAIAFETPAFLNSLRVLVNEFTAESEKANSGTVDESEEDKPFLHEKLLAIKAVCDDYNSKVIRDLLDELDGKAWSHPVNKFLGNLSVLLLHSEFENIENAIDEFLP